MARFLVVTRTCPGCKMPSHLPVSTFQELVRCLKYKRASFQGVFYVTRAT